MPEVAVILGSGLGKFANEIEIVDTISYNDIEGYPMQDVVLPTRLMGMMGAKKILLTNKGVYYGSEKNIRLCRPHIT